MQQGPACSFPGLSDEFRAGDGRILLAGTLNDNVAACLVEEGNRVSWALWLASLGQPDSMESRFESVVRPSHQLIPDIANDSVAPRFDILPDVAVAEITHDFATWAHLETALPIALEQHGQHVKVGMATCSPEIVTELFALYTVIVQQTERRRESPTPGSTVPSVKDESGSPRPSAKHSITLTLSCCTAAMNASHACGNLQDPRQQARGLPYERIAAASIPSGRRCRSRVGSELLSPSPCSCR